MRFPFIIIGLLVVNFTVEAQVIPISELKYDKGKHSKKKCTISVCHKRHVVTQTKIDSITGNETIETRTFPKTDKADRGEILRYKSVELTYDYTGKLLRKYTRKRDRHKRVSFKEANFTRDGKRRDKKVGNHRKKIVKEYDENGKLVRQTNVRKREFELKKDLTRN